MPELRNVRLPEDLCSAAEKKFAGRFPTIEDLLTFVLRDAAEDKASKLDQAEQKLVEQRLRELGYL